VAQTNQKVKKALLQKLDVSPQRLSQLAKQRKQQLPMSTALAVYTIAHENGIDISTHLSAEETGEVRTLMAQLQRAGSPAPTPPATNTTRRRGTRGGGGGKREVKVTIAGKDVGAIPALSPAHAAEAKRMSERAYPTLYLFENSVRDLIERVLEAAHGRDWWNAAVPSKVRATAEKHKKDEANDPWHNPRGRRPIDYVLLNDLWAIIKHNWPSFKALFPSQAWVESLITNDMNVSRRPIAHMNPLAAEDIGNIENAFRKWVKQLQAKKDDLP
jgi:hypothetical protein